MNETADKSATAERTKRAVLWLVIIGALVAGGYWRQQQGDANPQQNTMSSRRLPVDSSDGVPMGVSEPALDADGTPLYKVTLWADGIMGTNVQLTVWVEQTATAVPKAVEAGEAVFAIFRAVDTQFSTWKEDSEISRLNATAAAGPVACSPQMWELLMASREAYAVSDGGFDVTAGPLMKLWGFYKKRQTLPDAAELEAARALVGFDKLIFDDAARTVAFPVEGMALDFGGIAKGWSLDLAKAELRKRGIERALVDLGGNLLCLDRPPPGRDQYRIGIRHPRGGDDTAVTVDLLNAAVAASGDYERFVEIDGKRYAHIMDPRTGEPIAGMASVTVVAPTGIASDIASTAIFVSPERRDAIVAHYQCVATLIVRTDAAGKLEWEEEGAIWQHTDAVAPAPPAGEGPTPEPTPDAAPDAAGDATDDDPTDAPAEP